MAAIAVLVAAVAQAAAPTGTAGECSRACLRQKLDSYLEAVFRHDPDAAALTDDHYATENTVVTRNGDGFWLRIRGYGDAQRRYFDPVNKTAAYLGLLKQTNGSDVIASVRIRVEDDKVSEAEWIVGILGPGGRGESNPQGFVKTPPPEGAMPPGQRSSRFLMRSLANDYFQAIKDHDGSWIVVPNDPDCLRVENGGGQTGATGGGAVHPPGGCLANFGNMDVNTKDLAFRRFPLVDEEAGMVLGTALYVRYPDRSTLHNLVSEYFLIRDGKISGIWSTMYFLPLGAPDTTGWENRHGIWR